MNDVLAQLRAARATIDDVIGTLSASPPAAETAVHSSDNLLSMLSDAPAGATFVLDPNFVLDQGEYFISKPVTIRSALTLGPERVTDSLIGGILRGALTVTAPDVTLRGIRLEGKTNGSTILTTGLRTLLDRCAVIGSPTGQHHGIIANSAGVSVLKTHVGNIFESIESHAICAWTGCKDLLVSDCTLEASGINFMLGGEDSASESAIPQDVILENSRLTKPLAWKGQPGVMVKNLLELKSCQRVKVRGCSLENSWVQSQDGYAILLNVRNQNGGAPWSIVEDVELVDIDVRNVTAGLNILGSDYLHPSRTMRNVSIDRVRFNGIDGGRCVLIGRGPENLSLTNTTWVSATPPNSLLTFDNPELPSKNLRIIGNKFLEGWWSIKSDLAPIGVATLERYAPGYTWADNEVKKGPSGSNYRYPAGTTVQ